VCILFRDYPSISGNYISLLPLSRCVELIPVRSMLCHELSNRKHCAKYKQFVVLFPITAKNSGIQGFNFITILILFIYSVGTATDRTTWVRFLAERVFISTQADTYLTQCSFQIVLWTLFIFILTGSRGCMLDDRVSSQTTKMYHSCGASVGISQPNS
jgi:hypothetical protein